MKSDSQTQEAQREPVNGAEAAALEPTAERAPSSAPPLEAAPATEHYSTPETDAPGPQSPEAVGGALPSVLLSAIPSVHPSAVVDESGEVREEHRQTIAHILKSLTGSTVHGVADVNAVSERNQRELIGQRVNNFEITGLLSSGGMGDVFEAIHLVIHRKLAIKVLRAEHCADPVLVQRFFNEARAANSIRHPNIVEVLDVGMLPGGLPYIAMERLEGETLAHRLTREGRLDIERAVEYAVQAASALQAAHKRGIVHRDLKPDNLFIVADPRAAGRELIKVLDFGIAKLHGDKVSQVKTNLGSILGTPPYMSPEQCRGIPDAVDHRSDVYALGVILFEMLCGAPPFVAEGVGDILVMHLSSPPPLPTWRRKDIPLRIEQTILWAMEKNPDQRIPSMGDFIFTLGNGPTPVPYIVTPTGLTTADLPVSTHPTPGSMAPRYSAPAISLEGEFPEDTHNGPVAAATSQEPKPSARASRGPQVNDSPPPGRPRSAAAGLMAAAAGLLLLAGSAALFRQEGGSPVAADAPAVARPPGDGASPLADVEVTTGALHPSADRGKGASAASPSEGSSRLPADAASAGVEPAGELTAPAPVTPPLVAPQAVAPQPVARWTGRGRAWRPASSPNPLSAEPLAAEAESPLGERDPGLGSQTAVTPGSLTPVAEIAELPPAVAAEEVAPQPPLLAPTIEPIVTHGTLNFDSAPWARVSFDGRVLGVTPLRGVNLPAGVHRLRLENSELGTSTTFVVEVKAGQSVSRFVSWDTSP